MTPEKDGGTAFPTGPSGDSFTGDDGRTHHQFDGTPGMSLLDYFAGQALVGIFGANNYDIEYEGTPQEAAECAYRIADAMLEARKAVAQ